MLFPEDPLLLRSPQPANYYQSPMRFDQPQQPAPYLNRRDQWRLLSMVAVLCFVVIAILWAAQAKNWYWLIPPDNESAVNQPAPQADLQGNAPSFSDASSFSAPSD